MPELSYTILSKLSFMYFRVLIPLRQMEELQMRTLSVVSALLFCSASLSLCQQPQLGTWKDMIKDNRCEAAQKLCEGFVSSAQLSERVDAQKCLANAALCGHDTVQLQGDDAGGGTLGGGYDPEAVDRALVHLNQGIHLAPQDASIHQGRLHVLEVATRYSDMIRALDESCSIYKGSDALQIWLAYASELADLRQYNVGLEFMKVLDKHYPHSPDVIGNIGAFLDMLKRDQEAIPYLQQAAELAPKDPINAWDLARAYDYSEQIKLADSWYQKALSLETDPQELHNMSCMYAQFIEKKLHDTARSCPMERQNCEKEQQTACGVPSASSDAPAKQ